MRESYKTRTSSVAQAQPSANGKHFEDVKLTILRGIETLIPVAERNGINKARHSLLAQSSSLNQLGSRIDLHQLPDGFVRSIINDARLDVLMVLAELKVTLTFRKQDLAPAPLRAGLNTRHDDDATVSDESEKKRPVLHHEDVIADLKTVNEVELMLKECLL